MTKHPSYGKGACYQWLMDHRDYDGEGCLIWPFSRKPDTGYGQFGYKGKLYPAHRFMCALVNGGSPTPKHRAAHSCGMGHEGCVHPKHLSWKTNSENQKDRRIHGTDGRDYRGRSKLTAAQVAEIRALELPFNVDEVAAKYGIKRKYVYQLRSGRGWDDNTRWNQFSDDEVLRIRSFYKKRSAASVAREYDVKPRAIWQIMRGETYAHVAAQGCEQ